MCNIRKKFVFGIFLLIALTGMGGCHHTPDETLIRQHIDASAAAAQQSDAGELATFLTDDFSGNNGDVDRNTLLNLLRVAHVRGETIHVVMGPIQVDPRGERYVASFTVTLTSGGIVLPQNIGVYKVETAWQKDGRDWRCYAATWTQSL